VFGMIVDALILAGGRSSRLGDSDKRNLRIGDETLLERSLAAMRAAGARTIVVVGDGDGDDALTVREDPAFGGPVAAIAAGLAALPGDADLVLVAACDMPGIAQAMPPLLSGARGDGAIALDRGRRQHLALAVRPESLATALASLPSVVGASMRALLAPLHLTDVAVPDGATDDVDTWEDAERLGVRPPLNTGSTT